MKEEKIREQKLIFYAKTWWIFSLILATFVSSVFVTIMISKEVNMIVIIAICFFFYLLAFLPTLSWANKFEIQEDKMIIYQAVKLWKKKVFFYEKITKVIIRDGEGSHFLNIHTENRNYRFYINSEFQAIIQGHLREKGVKVKEKDSIYQKYSNL